MEGRSVPVVRATWLADKGVIDMGHSLTLGSPIEVNRSASSAPMAKMMHPEKLMATVELTSCACSAWIDHEPKPSQLKMTSAKTVPVQRAGIVKASDWAVGTKETRSACFRIAWLRVRPVERAVRTKSALTKSRRY